MAARIQPGFGDDDRAGKADENGRSAEPVEALPQDQDRENGGEHAAGHVDCLRIGQWDLDNCVCDGDHRQAAHKCPQDVKPVAGNRVPFAADRFSPHQKDRDDGKEPGAVTEKGDLDRCDRSVQKFWNREHDGEQ